MVEQWTFNPWVMGSSPIKPITDGSTIRPWNEILSRKGTNHDLEIVLFRSTMHSSCVWDVAKWQGKGLWSLDRRFDSFHPNLCQSIKNNESILLEEFFFLNAPFVYRLGRCPFTAKRRVRFPYGAILQRKKSKELFPYFLSFFCFLKHDVLF